MFGASQNAFEEPQRFNEQEGDKAEQRSSQNDRDRFYLARIGKRLLKGGEWWADAAREVTNDPGDERGKDDGVVDPAEIQDFNSEQGAGYRSAEHGGETGADSTNDQPAAIFIAQPEYVSEETRQCCANLRSGSFLAN